MNDGSDLFLSLRQLKHASTVKKINKLLEFNCFNKAFFFLNFLKVAARLLPQARAMVALNKALILLKMSKSNEALAIADQLEVKKEKKNLKFKKFNFFHSFLISWIVKFCLKKRKKLC